MDIRELEDFNRIPAKDGGDEYLVNGNMLPVKDAEQFYQTKTTGSNQAWNDFGIGVAKIILRH